MSWAKGYVTRLVELRKTNTVFATFYALGCGAGGWCLGRATASMVEKKIDAWEEERKRISQERMDKFIDKIRHDLAQQFEELRSEIRKQGD